MCKHRKYEMLKKSIDTKYYLSHCFVVPYVFTLLDEVREQNVKPATCNMVVSLDRHSLETPYFMVHGT